MDGFFNALTATLAEMKLPEPKKSTPETEEDYETELKKKLSAVAEAKKDLQTLKTQQEFK